MRLFLVGVIMGALIAMVNNWSFEDELAQEKLYCEMNSGGLWYDSPERYAKICPGQRDSEATPQALEGQERTNGKKTVSYIF